MVIEKYLPKCECFQDEDTCRDMIASSIKIGQTLAALMMKTMKDTGMCEKSRQHVMDDAVIAMVVAVAIHGTIIESGSDDAERETVRVLTGLEARLLEKVQCLYEVARDLQSRGELPRVNGRGETVQ